MLVLLTPEVNRKPWVHPSSRIFLRNALAAPYLALRLPHGFVLL